MDEMDALRAELEHYKTQRQRIRDIIGQIGGKTGRRLHAAVNILFLVLVLGAFAFDVVRHLVGWEMPYLPTTLVLEIAVLLVSLKIIWMIHTQSKVDHFQFWVLNTIEFQINVLSRRFMALEKDLRKRLDTPGTGDAGGTGAPSDPS